MFRQEYALKTQTLIYFNDDVKKIRNIFTHPVCNSKFIISWKSSKLKKIYLFEIKNNVEFKIRLYFMYLNYKILEIIFTFEEQLS